MPTLVSFLLSATLAWGQACAPHFTHKHWSRLEKHTLFSLMVAGAQRLSRTVSDGTRPPALVAPPSIGTLPEEDVARLAEANFRKAAALVLSENSQLTINRQTLERLNTILTHGLVDSKVIGKATFRPIAEHIQFTDPFIAGSAAQFYEWLESDTAHRWNERDPIGFAEILHNTISSLDAFPDGNGRLARLAADLALIRSGFPVVFYDSREEYFLLFSSELNRNSFRGRETRRTYFHRGVQHSQQILDYVTPAPLQLIGP